MRETPKADVSWYIFREGRQLGPISHIELLRLVELGQVYSGDLFWRAGLSDWVVADVVLSELSRSTSALEETRAKTPTKSRQNNFLIHAIVSLLNPIERFYHTAYLITTSPTYFAINHIAINDRTNFVRGIGLYAQAVSYYFILLASVRLISRQPIQASEIRLLLLTILVMLLFTLIFFGASKLFISGGVSFRKILHVATYVFAAASAFSGLYFVSFAIFEFILAKNGVNLFPEVFPDPFLTGMNKCLAQHSIPYFVLFGEDPAMSTKVPILATVVRSGLIWSLVFIIPAARITTALFGISFRRSAFWIISSTVLSYVIFFFGMFFLVFTIASHSNCTAEVLYRMGKKDPNILLMRLERDLNKDLPMKITNGLIWIRVEAREGELVNYYDHTEADLKLPAENLTEIHKKSAIQSYCYATYGTVDYVVALRRLGIPVRDIRNFNAGQIVINVVARATDCKAEERKQ